MPAVPPAAPMYVQQTVAQQVNQIPPQSSPTGSANSRPSPPTAAIQRHHATPPQTSSSPNELGVSPSLSQISQNHNYNAHYNHTIGRAPAPAPSLTRYQNLDDHYHITPELLEEIERADLQQSQTQSVSPAFTNYPRNGSTTPPRDHMDRVRIADRASPKDLDSRRPRDAIPARESPTVRQPHSPTVFAPAQSSNPDRRASESPARASPLGGGGGSSGETYTPYMTRDSPPVHRRAVGILNSEPRAQYSPLQASQGRSSDRSLPVQEEPEDDPHLTAKNDPWKGLEHLENHHHTSSPTPSSDLHPEGNPQRFEPSHSSTSIAGEYLEDSETEGTKTPRSPSVGLPDKNVQSTVGGTRAPVRVAGRAASMDQYALRGIDETIYQPNSKNMDPEQSQPSNAQRSGQYAQQRKLSVDPNHHYYQTQYYADESSPYSGHYHAGQFHPDDYYGDPALYHDPHYAERSRPDAPIPPTPHSQTAAPSPSPFPNMYARNGRNFHAPSPVAPAGSPYPYPFEHVRRNINLSRNARPHMFDPHDPNYDMNMIRDQVAGQWQKFAQNTHALGNMSDSTFSPSSTPFQGNFAPWASLHARRTLGRAFDLRSMQSSPGLERHDRPEQPPAPPASVFRSKKHRASKLSTEIPAQAPPRVQSTQPRDTSPEPSTSGEETAGEEHYSVANPNRNSWGNGSAPDRVVEEDGDGDWVDEDDEPDEDDLLELEYHPSYVKNVTRRRRRWEVGWEGLLEAFQALDRQTDATMVLLAAPSHSTKLYSVRSRSVRRHASQVGAPDITPLKIGFKRIAAHRRKTRSHSKPSLVDRFLVSSGTSGEGSDGSETREEDLKRAFGVAVSSLGAFEHIFAEREARWAEEMKRISEDRERVEILLRQVIGERHASNTTPTGSLL
ncbi:hypothetical protein P691DRAFT_759020 [Macrolepiota fuliginosa MF-IS2]|uniref:Uncharacterized protein n=1 Tax=Macrolepiota fuliginosa MF-IS2 TaxID=1400762 RepID=A0A9P5XGQ4_9AGAR|nr:hypothetical protein P691DRAFT_759020 [Macrolepiota fuliginosa MF-IS2]